MEEMNYKKAFEWVCNLVHTEYERTIENLDETKRILRYCGQKSSSTLHGLIGMRHAYGKIQELCDEIKGYSVNEYDKCDEVTRKCEES